MTTHKNVAIIGDGGWGTALAMVLQNNGHAVTAWGPFPDYIQTIRTSKENRTYLPGISLPPSIQWTHDRAEAVRNADLVVVAVPTRYYGDVVRSFADLIPTKASVVSVSKGFDPQRHCRMSELAAEILCRDDISVLSGPSLADEVARRVPTAVVIAARDASRAVELQGMFSNDRFRAYTGTDVVGVELGGALKNVIAVAVGVSDGLGFGDNTRAALITRGLAEVTRLGCALGAQRVTFSGLSGMGDLIVTCTSRLSRNRGVGERIGKGEKTADILGGMKQVAEGVWNCAIVLDLARKHQVDVPIVEQVHAIVHETRSPLDAVTTLLRRERKPED